MTSTSSTGRRPTPLEPSPPIPASAGAPTHRLPLWVPTWGLITTKQLELRKRRGLMIVVVLLTVGIPLLVLGFRLLLQAINAKAYGPAGSPLAFASLSNVIAEFGFIVAAVLGTAAATTDLSQGVFRHLVATGRSRLALYLARIPAGLAILLPLVAVAFVALCLVTSYDGTAQPPSMASALNGVPVPAHLDETQLRSWLEQHPQQAALAFGLPQTHMSIARDMIIIYGEYSTSETAAFNPAPGEMAKVGLWLELEVGIGFLVGLGLGSLTGQRTLSTIVLIALEIIVTPLAASHVIPYLLDGQRLIVGVAIDQLRPAVLAFGGAGGGPLSSARGGLGIPPMPTWAMVAVIVGWIVGWSLIGAWRMVTRDA